MINQHIIYKNYEKALKTQKKRYKSRVDEMIKRDYLNMWFLTFTFSDESLLKTNEKTRIRYIKEFLKQQAKNYLLNKDYGKENKREHYHAIIISKYEIINFDAYKYGYIKARKISQMKHFNTTKNNRTTADKLTAHAFKETTENAKIIYSRRQIKQNRRFKKAINKRLNTWKESDKAKQ